MKPKKLTGKSIKVKILVDGNREGWYSLDDIARESTEAEAADTSSDDTLFMFFTSGTTGLPKIVCHSQLSQPFGHLTTASWIGLKVIFITTSHNPDGQSFHGVAFSHHGI